MAPRAKHDVREAQAAAAEFDRERVARFAAVGEQVLAGGDHGQSAEGVGGSDGGRRGPGPNLLSVPRPRTDLAPGAPARPAAMASAMDVAMACSWSGGSAMRAATW